MAVTAANLQKISTWPLPAVESYAVAEHIAAGKRLGEFYIAYVNTEFATHFYGLVEEDVPEREIQKYEIRRLEDYRDERIIEAMGGDINNLGPAAISLAHFFGIPGLGTTRGYGEFGRMNIGYAMSPLDLKPRAVYWHTYLGKYFIGARKIAAQPGWHPGVMAFGSETVSIKKAA
jgi:hypothetical protein